MKNIVVLGATGSIGTQALDVIRNNKGRFRLLGVTANKDVAGILRVAKEFGPMFLGMSDPEAQKELSEEAKRSGISSLVASPLTIAALEPADVVLSAVVGISGLPLAEAALKAGKKLALANKEAIVCGGRLLRETAKRFGGELIPVDSEHSAIFECLTLGSSKEVESITLTASGGAFRDYDRAALEAVTPELAVTHPVWKMGKKVTVDSATLMNKGLEVIEAARFFDLPISKIKVLMHRESVIHGMASFTDGTVMAALGKPDMRVPIALSMSWPERVETGVEPINLADVGKLNFAEPDFERYKCLRLAYEAEEKGESAVVAMSAADEVAVRLFLDRKIKFTDIADIVEDAILHAEARLASDFKDILNIDRYTREYIFSKIKV